MMTNQAGSAERGFRVLIFAPVGRDGELTSEVLERADIATVLCPSIDSVCSHFDADGAGAVLLTEEAFADSHFEELRRQLDEQPPWSDVPVLLFAGGPGTDMTRRTIRSMEMLRNVTLLERPIRLAAVISTIRAALRGRARQYEVRDLLVALHKARTEAESANRLKDEFLATLSHELRTPLNAILGWTSMLTRGEIDDSRLPRVFEALDRNAQSQAQLIADVLDVSRIISGKLKLECTTVDICDLVARASDAVRPAAAAKDISLEGSEPAQCFVRGDPDRLQQVFWNLLSNAVKFTPAGGSIRVEITRDRHTISVSVLDTGTGIAPEFVPYVFDRFRQADQTTTRAHGGLGLGLSIVKHLTEMHGGSVTAASDGPGKGARFTVRLRALETGVQPHKAPEGSDDSGVHLNGWSILVVDDDESTREVIAAALERADGAVRLASSAADGWRSLEERIPDLIVADLGMPGEDGYSFIRRVRQSRARNVPAIALSAYADHKSKSSAIAAGFTAFLAKPTRPQQLLDLVGALLASHHMP
jgi:signal transduction histidine kinase/CheY-like chemotaxis protein